MHTGMLFFICWLGLVISLPVQAEIYRWTDANGQTHFGEKPPRGQGADVVEQQPLNTMQPPPEVPSLINWREREQQVQQERRAQRLRQEKQQQAQEKQQQRCQQARDSLREFERRSYTDTSLTALQKRTLRRERLRASIKKNC